MSSKSSTPRDAQPRRRFSLELLPRKPTQSDIQEVKRQARLDSSRTPKPSGSPTTRQHQSLLESPKRTKQQQQQQQRSYQSIEDFMKDITSEEPKQQQQQLDMAGLKVTSTPSRNVRNVLQDSYFSHDSTDEKPQESGTWASLASPRNNKSVLKSTTSGNGGMSAGVVKKKVLFDLMEKEGSERDSTTTATKSAGEFVAAEGRDEVVGAADDSDSNISRFGSERFFLVERRDPEILVGKYLEFSGTEIYVFFCYYFSDLKMWFSE